MTLGVPRRPFLILSAAYAALVAAILFSISGYFGAGWDPQIFAQVGRAAGNPAAFDLYEVSRRTWGDWGYPYPPLYAQLLAPWLALNQAVPMLPDWALVRAPAIIFDLALAVVVYLALVQHGARGRLAWLGAVLWLFNPITLYQTAVQAHQEASWLACVAAAYALTTVELRRQRGSLLLLPSLLMALALSFKQSAILFCIPYAVLLLQWNERRRQRLLAAAALAAIVFGGLSLPYLLHSDDYFYLVYTAVSNMPVQTQSAVVWLLGIPGYLRQQTVSDFFLLKYQAIITMALAFILSWLALRRERDLFRAGLLMALLFFLTSKKVMGYHYPLLLPFLLVYALPRRRYDLIGLGIIAASWIILSPYYAPWAAPAHLALYAALGTPNTLLWLWLFGHVWRGEEHLRLGRLDVTGVLNNEGALLPAVAILTTGMLLASLAQPWAGSAAPALQVLLLLFVLVLTTQAALTGVRALVGGQPRLRAGHIALALLFVPVYFASLALTHESTSIIEGLLK